LKNENPCKVTQTVTPCFSESATYENLNHTSLLKRHLLNLNQIPNTLGIHAGNGCEVDNIRHLGASWQQVNRLIQSDNNRANRIGVA
jgi:hypothetical protein